MNWCQWCPRPIEARYKVSTQETKAGTQMVACGRHLGRAVDFFVMAEGKTTVERLK